MTTRTGRCLCRAVTYAFDEPVKWVSHCHCESCRRNTSSPFTTFVSVPRRAFRFTGSAPAVYESSPGVRRSFCARCGAPVAYETDSLPDEIHVYLAALDDASRLAPQNHDFFAEKVPWVTLGDDLPRHEDFPGSPSAEA